MRKAPGTNLGTESKFAHVDNNLKRPGDLLAYKIYQISMSSNKILLTQNWNGNLWVMHREGKNCEGQMEVHKQKGNGSCKINFIRKLKLPQNGF